MSQPLVIVESPAKARTIAGYLGDDYMVESSIGHVRDLPKTAAEVPKSYKSEKWARLGIDVENDFKPLYVVSQDKKDHVKKLKTLLKDASELVLATDEDREGEAIAWHLLEVLNPRIPVKRMVFHEITPEAIRRAIESPRELDRRLVDAQEARRLLDRLYGYEVSPVLWKKVKPRLSAGRVQSVATRIIVERERERMAFRSANYWDLTGTFAAGDDRPFTAMLLELDDRRIATGKDFAQSGELAKGEVVHLDEPSARALAADLEDRPAAVKSREAKPYRRRPAAPFITSTYQQEASRKLRLSSAQAMRVAQGLYERGYITYMRTDSTTLSDTAVAAARSQIAERYGSEYVPDAPRSYQKRVKNAQEAHEAIRPAGDRFRPPEDVAGELNNQDRQVYELIWQRTVASQMTDATGETVTLRLGVESRSGRQAVFSTAGTVITHQGFLKVYVESTDDEDESDDASEKRLPALYEGDRAHLGEVEAAGHDTQPPARYTEASLVKRLEELGVGRPSTYASIMGTIQARGYAWKKGTALVPSFLAFAVVTLLEQHFPDLVDYAFTAQMENDLDEIASGAEAAVPWLTEFYFGAEDYPGLRDKVNDRLGDIDARAVNSIPIGVDSDGVPIVARVGQYGPYLQRGEDTKSIPDDIPPDELTAARAEGILSVPDEIPLGEHPQTGLPVIVKDGKFGPYVQMGAFDADSDEKPRTSSLFEGMSMGELTLEQAVELLTIPRVVGSDPSDGMEIVARNGPHGPYIEKGTKGDEGHDTRSFEAEAELLTMDLPRALELFAEPKRRRGARNTGPLKRLGIDPVTDLEVVVKDGRFGEYVTDGQVNASLQQGDSVERVDIMRASELLTIRRQKMELEGPKPAKKAAKKSTKKNVAAKRSGGKKARKKPAAKETAANDPAAKKPTDG
ncbi:MAG: type I DNA topoisomerase [Acidimicrobiia bacterium]|nr:type I DNA topoisomerase [Acidimicrobiia bacterium]